MDDLGKRCFDLVASGISITPERQRLADFSAAYLVDGKTPIARRAVAARLVPQVNGRPNRRAAGAGVGQRAIGAAALTRLRHFFIGISRQFHQDFTPCLHTYRT